MTNTPTQSEQVAQWRAEFEEYASKPDNHLRPETWFAPIAVYADDATNESWQAYCAAMQRHSPSTVEGEAVAWTVADFAEHVAVRVAEIPDRNSPDDQPEMMLVTAKELKNIIEWAFECMGPPHPQQSVAMDEEVMCEACKGSGEGPIVNVGDGEPYWDRQTSCAPCKGTGVIIRATPVGKVCDDFLRGVSQQSVAVPEGWKLVPVEPTHEMLFEPHASAMREGSWIGTECFKEWYRMMITAAPNPPHSVGQKDESK